MKKQFKKRVFESHADGDANFYTITKDSNWFCKIQMNGEMTVGKQEVYLQVIVDALNKGI
jgi:hypothetical protein